jgi:hypothetical protein
MTSRRHVRQDRSSVRYDKHKTFEIISPRESLNFCKYVSKEAKDFFSIASFQKTYTRSTGQFLACLRQQHCFGSPKKLLSPQMFLYPKRVSRRLKYSQCFGSILTSGQKMKNYYSMRQIRTYRIPQHLFLNPPTKTSICT